MIFRRGAIAAALLLAAGATTANAYELGYSGVATPPGITLGAGTAGAPPPGVYMFDQFLTYQAHIIGPGAPNIGGSATQVHVAGASTGFVIVPGWTFLGATYNAVVVAPFLMADVGSPLNVQKAGAQNTYIVPVELSWKLGDSGFFAKTGLGIHVPDGSTSGTTALGNVGTPWWTFQPEFAVSYLKDGWNLTANLFEEINTKNPITGYTSGDVLHAEFTATKNFDNWTLGPVAYYVGQVTDDASSAFYHGLVNVNRYNVWAAGAKVGYNFGRVQLNVWALDELSANASGGPIPGATFTKGYAAFTQISYRLWAPDEPAAPITPLIHK